MDPLRVEIDAAARKVLVTYQTQPTFAEWKAAIEPVFRNPQYRPGFSFLLDRTAVAQPATTEHIRMLAEFIDARLREQGVSRWAIVVSDLGSYGMGRMLEQISEYQYCIRTFRSLDAAADWLAEAA